MKEILYGTNEKEPQTEAVAQLAQELYNSGLLSTLVADLQLIDFEVRSSLLNSQKTLLVVLSHAFYSLGYFKIPVDSGSWPLYTRCTHHVVYEVS